MRKKILITIGVLAVVIIVGMVYLNNRNRTLSPPGEAVFDKGGLYIHIKYSRPSVRDRLIFGAEEDGALQPYGHYWRLGANEATSIEIKQDILFNGVPLKAGTYSLYAVPGPEHFVIGVNENNDRWGYSEPDYDEDLLTTKVPVSKLEDPVEQYTIRIEDDVDGALIFFEWSDVQFSVPIGLN